MAELIRTGEAQETVASAASIRVIGGKGKDTKMMKEKEPKRGSFDYLLDGNSVHIEPPPPLRGGGPSRIHIQIEITDSRKAVRRRDRNNAIWWVFAAVLFALMISVAHGQTRWQENRVGGTIYWNELNTGVRGQEWTEPNGTVRQEFQDPKGHVTHCATQTFGNVLRTECH